ncbi:TfoX/Sxy family protein [Oceanibium sediminis]|uniref:TfoX/Sxy family protein n=1 Tax=Oceanibium sediminis TaxID=2026339 RepID=UPI000DD300FE|nr:TfoX/Sxy family protein [Oceanibium sediminis]
MAFDEEQAERLRDRLAGHIGITEKKMFGGLCFLLNGNMLAGIHGAKMGGGAMFRVGPEREAAALALPGTAPMTMTGRRMRGFVDAPADLLEDEAQLAAILALAMEYVSAMPAK